MVFERHRKDTIGQTKAIAKLIEMDFDVFLPIGDHLPFDLIAYKDGKFLRIQSKYTSTGMLNKKSSWYTKTRLRTKQYYSTDFDYYAAYLPGKNAVIFPSIKFAGCTISTTVPNSPTPFYWWEDFSDFTNEANKRDYKEFGLSFSDIAADNFKELIRKGVPHPDARKVEWPSADDLRRLRTAPRLDPDRHLGGRAEEESGLAWLAKQRIKQTS